MDCVQEPHVGHGRAEGGRDLHCCTFGCLLPSAQQVDLGRPDLEPIYSSMRDRVIVRLA